MAEESRRGRWIPVVYYYLATAVGLAITLVGLIQGLHGLVIAAIPQVSDEVRFISVERHFGPEGEKVRLTEEEKTEAREEAIERARLGGFAGALKGLITALVGAPVFFWHLRQARRREPAWLGMAPPGG